MTKEIQEKLDIARAAWAARAAAYVAARTDADAADAAWAARAAAYDKLEAAKAALQAKLNMND